MSSTFSDSVLENLSQRFTAHAAIYQGRSAENASPLYAALSGAVAYDPEVLELVRQADPATQIPNMLFGAVHDLLLGSVAHPLETFYPSLTPSPSAPDEAYPAFRAFCLEHATEVRQRVETRRVQTNEVQRCTGLLLAFAEVARRYGGRPLALVEVGASAGLNLLWDRYGYRYEGLGRVGDSSAAVQLACRIEGATTPPLPQSFPKVASRVGIDLLPIDVNNKEATRWVRALIWPEHTDRAERFDSALQIALTAPPKVLAGDAAERLPKVMAELPQDALACVYHSYTLNQCPREVRERIVEEVRKAAHERSVVRVSLEWYGGQPQPQLELFEYGADAETATLLARCESHGRAVEWLPQVL